MQHHIFLCFALFSLMLAQEIAQARRIECRVTSAPRDVEELMKTIKTSCMNYQCNNTDGGTAHNTYNDQEKQEGCGCLDIPQNTCNLSCFKSGLKEIKKHQLGDPKLLSRLPIMITGCKDLLCAQSHKKPTFGNWYSFLEELRSAFQQIAGEAGRK